MRKTIAAIAMLCASIAANARSADPAVPPTSTYAAVTVLEVPEVAGNTTDRRGVRAADS